nr:unnamed protein product [Digitaria exilis]
MSSLIQAKNRYDEILCLARFSSRGAGGGRWEDDPYLPCELLRRKKGGASPVVRHKILLRTDYLGDIDGYARCRKGNDGEG